MLLSNTERRQAGTHISRTTGSYVKTRLDHARLSSQLLHSLLISRIFINYMALYLHTLTPEFDVKLYGD